MAKKQDWIIGGAIVGSALLLIILLMIAFSKGFDGTLLSKGKDFSPYVRLGIQFASAAIPIAAGIGIAFISNPFAA